MHVSYVCHAVWVVNIPPIVITNRTHKAPLTTPFEIDNPPWLLIHGHPARNTKPLTADHCCSCLWWTILRYEKMSPPKEASHKRGRCIKLKVPGLGSKLTMHGPNLDLWNILLRVKGWGSLYQLCPCCLLFLSHINSFISGPWVFCLLLIMYETVISKLVNFYTE